MSLNDTRGVAVPRAAQPLDAALLEIAQRHRLRPNGSVNPVPFAREVLATYGATVTQGSPHG